MRAFNGVYKEVYKITVIFNNCAESSDYYQIFFSQHYAQLILEGAQNPLLVAMFVQMCLSVSSAQVAKTGIAQYRLVWVSVWEPYMQLLHCVPDLHCFF